MGRLVARGKYLYDGDRKFFARGVSYGPFAPNSRGERYPEPQRARADFAMMRELGVNVLRLYVPAPSWMIDEAASAGLRVMAGIPWPFHMAFLDSRRTAREIRATIRGSVADLRKFGDAIMAYSLGNEIRSDIVRWHGRRAVSGFLAQLYDIGKQLDPEGLFTYSNYPPAEYLDLSFLDFASFNVYLHEETDYRRYLTHLLAISGDRPLILSETGVDTIRHGEGYQAEVLGWQGRAAFEAGLAGFIAFAFTDEWHTGGTEITDWAFGVTTRDRKPKPAFRAIQEVFSGELPGPLPSAPKVSVVVAAYNAAGTIGACLESLGGLNYPDYEVIVVDDGSGDATAAMAAEHDARVMRIDHRGLAAARNAGIDAASGGVIAFIDADARADRDWLYHLVEVLVRRRAAAAGGPNFAPEPSSARAAAMAAAPGLPCEVRAGDDGLSQLCGCNMAIMRTALSAIGGFDPAFTTAGDDVDLSWRLIDHGESLAYASGAVVVHERRATLGAYLAQQRGYGAGEGLLDKSYPARAGAPPKIYGGVSRLGSLIGRARIYYGAFGRGLFQSIYRTPSSPLIELPLSIYWMALSPALLLLGCFNRSLEAIGWAGVAGSIFAAAAGAARTPLDRRYAGPMVRIRLFTLNLLGPAVRSAARERLRWRFDYRSGVGTARMKMKGKVVFAPCAARGGRPIDRVAMIAGVRRAIIKRGAAVAATDGFQSYDLLMMVPPGVRVRLNAIREDGGRIALQWQAEAAPGCAVITCAILLIVLLAAGLTAKAAIVAMIVVAMAAGIFAFGRARRACALIADAAAEASSELGTTLDEWAKKAA
ncbi:MAG TPA: glycosyltransferase [Candidatus Binataceae bacterium]|nr:glycosyltransferase [Candidatus Binataceae bacterium]